MTLFFTNHQVTIYRTRRVGASDRYALSATGTVAKADITPASLERTQFENSAIGKTYIGYMEVAVNVKEGDEIVITDTTTLNNKRFSVRGVSTWEGEGIVDVKELTLVAKD